MIDVLPQHRQHLALGEELATITPGRRPGVGLSGAGEGDEWVVIVGSGSGEWRKVTISWQGVGKKKRYLILLNIVLNEQGIDRESFIVRDQKC